jgi:hypothetical protein
LTYAGLINTWGDALGQQFNKKGFLARWWVLQQFHQVGYLLRR